MATLAQSPFSGLIGPVTVTWEPVPVFEALVRSDCRVDVRVEQTCSPENCA